MCVFVCTCITQRHNSVCLDNENSIVVDDCKKHLILDGDFLIEYML